MKSPEDVLATIAVGEMVKVLFLKEHTPAIVIGEVTADSAGNYSVGDIRTIAYKWTTKEGHFLASGVMRIDLINPPEPSVGTIVMDFTKQAWQRDEHFGWQSTDNRSTTWASLIENNLTPEVLYSPEDK